MYKNIKNYYFSRPDYGYAYANPYGMNFSRSYPRVVVYNGQQNFNKFTDFVKKHGRKAALAGALLAAGIPAAHQAGKSVGENTRVEHTAELEEPLGVYPDFGDGMPVVKYGTFYVGHKPEAPHFVDPPVYHDFYEAEHKVPRTSYDDEHIASVIGRPITDKFFRYWKPPKGAGFNTKYPYFSGFAPEKGVDAGATKN